MPKRIIFTGGSGKAGKHSVQHLVDHGYEVLNLDTKPLANPKVRTLITDITDAGQVYKALSSNTNLHEFDPVLKPQKIDAVVHFAAIPRIMIVPDNELFRINVMGTYNVIEAAVTLGIKKIIIASSETTYGVIFADTPREPRSLPLEEDYDTDPMDSYALSKVVNEKTARAFALRGDFDIYALRIGNVIEPHEYKDAVPKWKAEPGGTQEAHLELHRRTRSGRDRAPLHREGRARLPGLQRREQRFIRRPADQGAFEALLSERAGDARDGRIRVALLQQEDPRGAGVQGGASLAEEYC